MSGQENDDTMDTTPIAAPRRCVDCDTDDTPVWRCGGRFECAGFLCNACWLYRQRHGCVRPTSLAEADKAAKLAAAAAEALSSHSEDDSTVGAGALQISQEGGPCVDCGTTESPQWRTGVRWGVGALCNACGIYRRRHAHARLNEKPAVSALKLTVTRKAKTPPVMRESPTRSASRTPSATPAPQPFKRSTQNSAASRADVDALFPNTADAAVATSPSPPLPPVALTRGTPLKAKDRRAGGGRATNTEANRVRAEVARNALDALLEAAGEAAAAARSASSVSPVSSGAQSPVTARPPQLKFHPLDLAALERRASPPHQQQQHQQVPYEQRWLEQVRGQGAPATAPTRPHNFAAPPRAPVYYGFPMPGVPSSHHQGLPFGASPAGHPTLPPPPPPPSAAAPHGWTCVWFPTGAHGGPQGTPWVMPTPPHGINLGPHGGAAAPYATALAPAFAPPSPPRA